MTKSTSVINLDPIDRAKKKNKGIIGRFLITRYAPGKPVVKSEPYGHYMFCGAQGSGKSASSLWYAEKIAKKYKKRCIKYTTHDDCDNRHLKCKTQKFDTPPKIVLYSNIDIGRHIEKTKIFDTIASFDEYANEIRIVLLDEIHTYFPRGSADKESNRLRDQLVSIFSQLRKRNTFILSTAQVYGRLDKSLREQCLFMIACKVSLGNKLINDFILGDDIICDELGRLAGNPRFIYKHGLAKSNYDTKKIIRS